MTLSVEAVEHYSLYRYWCKSEAISKWNYHTQDAEFNLYTIALRLCAMYSLGINAAR